MTHEKIDCYSPIVPGAVPVEARNPTAMVKVPRRNLFGIGKQSAFFGNLTTGLLMIRRGAGAVLPDGTCCSSKQWLTVEAGPFMIETKGLPGAGYWNNNGLTRVRTNNV